MNQRELLCIKEFKTPKSSSSRQELLQVGNLCPSGESPFHETL
jgi:hypothetical protein